MCANRTRFDKLLDSVTRPDIVDGKRALKRKLLEMICKGDVEPEHALFSITAKMANTDPCIVILSIDILDSWVMICGRLIQDEIVKVSYMEMLKELLENTSTEKIKLEILHLIHDWSQTLEDPIIRETVQVLKAKGYEFPSESDMLSEFEELQVRRINTCHRCNVMLFSWENKKNCEVCGKKFCTECLIKRNDDHDIINLVCEVCEQLIIRNKTENNSTELTGNEARNLNKSIDYLEDNEEDLHLAIALSKSEQVTDKLNAPHCKSSQSSYKATDCSVCCDRRIDSMLHPCSHLCMCFNCAIEQWKGAGNGGCPLCRIEIEDVTYIE